MDFREKSRAQLSLWLEAKWSRWKVRCRSRCWLGDQGYWEQVMWLVSPACLKDTDWIQSWRGLAREATSYQHVGLLGQVLGMGWLEPRRASRFSPETKSCHPTPQRSGESKKDWVGVELLSEQPSFRLSSAGPSYFGVKIQEHFGASFQNSVSPNSILAHCFLYNFLTQT